MPTSAGASGGAHDATVHTGPPSDATDLDRALAEEAQAADTVERMKTKLGKAKAALADAQQSHADAEAHHKTTRAQVAAAKKASG